MAPGRHSASDPCVCVHGVFRRVGKVRRCDHHLHQGCKGHPVRCGHQRRRQRHLVPSEDYDATEEQLEAAQLVIENRLVALNVTDYELYVDPSSDSMILEFPWQSGETDFDPESAIQEIGTTAI